MMDRSDFEGALIRIDEQLSARQPPVAQAVCVFGAAALLLYGSDHRRTPDIDVWEEASEFDPSVLGPAAEAAGSVAGAIPSGPLVRLRADDGSIPFPAYSKESGTWAGGSPSEMLWTGRHLTVSTPPAALLAASKMARFGHEDIDDVVYVLARRRATPDEIRAAALHLPADSRGAADQNGVLLLPYASLTYERARVSGRGEASSRDIRAAGERLLIRLASDSLALAKAVGRRDVESLAGAAWIASREVPTSMAMTHPARYRALRNGVTQYYSKGYGILDLDTLARAAAAAMAAREPAALAGRGDPTRGAG